MLTHSQVWNAIDALASRYAMTASGLAKKAGLDATTFNKSKRSTPEGRLRWPSTESISKVLEATGATLDEFINLVSVKAKEERANPRVPLIGLAQAPQGAGLIGYHFGLTHIATCLFIRHRRVHT